jgi:eukaryotic-like serine/threonine-protein kinase
MDSDNESRELLFAATAIRLGFVDRSALIRLLNGGTYDRGQSLARLMTERGLLNANTRATVEAEVLSTLRSHKGDADLALAQSGPIAEELKSIVTRNATQKTIGGGNDNFNTIGDEPAQTIAPEPLPHTSPGSGAAARSQPDLAETQARTGEETVSRAGATQFDSYATQSVYRTDQEVIERLRYRILRSHAKGGLGEVFLANDQELNREVALKEIQGRHANDEQSRLRFMIEAEVTGNLEHPGIVPVYGLGRYPDGRPYYAMRFVRGISLKEAIARFHQAETAERDPGTRAIEFRTLLGQLVDVCNAMAYAHNRGVLHRDLKPANVMLGAFGETLVVDWGLAKFKDIQEAPTEANSHLIRPMSAGSSSRTLFGSAVGTPQYMSPEQAAGQLDQLGPATDIYSLGAILYTILVGNAAFLDRDLLVLLDKVRKGDFRPPREVDPKVHPALDAICRKAMALRPEDRYSSARTLADDVEHWLADEPVSVYREPVIARLARWARRHKTAVAATAALLLTAVVSLAIYSVLIKRERDRTERFYVLARGAVDEMLTQLGKEDLANVPQMEPVRARMLQKAKDFYEKLLTARAGDPRAARDAALATVRLADIETLIGDKGAMGRYDDAVKKLQDLRRTGASNQNSTLDLAGALHARGLLLRQVGRYDDAEHDLSEALSLRNEMLARSPDDLNLQRARIDSLYHLAALHDRVGNAAKAKEEYGDVLAAAKTLANGPSGTLDDLRLLGRYTNNMANLVARGKAADQAEAKGLYDAALEIQKDVVKRDPVTAFYRYELAKTHGNLRIAAASEGDLPSAETHAVEDVALSSRLVNDFPRVPDYRIKLATARSNLGVLRIDLKQPGPASTELSEAITVAKGMVDEYGDRRDCRSVLAAALVNRALTEKDPEAEADLVQARDALIPIANRATPAAEDLLDLGTVYYKLAKVRSQQKRVKDALDDLDKAVALHERASSLGRTGDGLVERAQVLARSGEGAAPPLWLDVALQCRLLQETGEYARCADVCERLPALRPGHDRSYVMAAQMLAFLAAQPSVEETARSYASRALKQLRAAASQGLLKTPDLENPYYGKVREFFPDDFRALANAVKQPNKV